MCAHTHTHTDRRARTHTHISQPVNGLHISQPVNGLFDSVFGGMGLTAALCFLWISHILETKKLPLRLHRAGGCMSWCYVRCNLIPTNICLDFTHSSHPSCPCPMPREHVGLILPRSATSAEIHAHPVQPPGVLGRLPFLPQAFGARLGSIWCTEGLQGVIAARFVVAVTPVYIPQAYCPLASPGLASTWLGLGGGDVICKELTCLGGADVGRGGDQLSFKRLRPLLDSILPVSISSSDDKPFQHKLCGGHARVPTTSSSFQCLHSWVLLSI